jgi:hypothetical protein
MAPAAATAASVAHGAFPVRLTKTWDSGRLKVGDVVEADTAGGFKLPGGSLVPKGSKLIGHVTAATARSKGDSTSTLRVMFDKLNLADGKQLSVKGTVQAVFPAEEEAAPQMAGKASGAAGGGYSGPTIGTVTDTKSGSNMESSSKPSSPMDIKATGVQGIKEVELGSDGAVLSTGKNIKLGAGVQMIVRVEIF